MKILITGASRGLGAALAKQFAANEGTELFLVSRNKQALARLKKEINHDFPCTTVFSFGMDLEDEESISDLINEMQKKTRHLDIIINNAGRLIKKDFWDMGRLEINALFSVNYLAPALIIREAIPLLKRAENPHIVNISSMGGFQGSMKFAGLSHYSASKGAIAVLTECLAAEFKGEISVNCLAIGSVQTEMLEEAFPGYEAPLKPAEMAEYVCDFAINAHRYMNGKIVPVSLTNP
ncbi:MAG: SDR family NAD(P)-dependent oxidoreductase [Bacteroidota bacterium]